MSLMSFIRKQFIDVIQWTEDSSFNSSLSIGGFGADTPAILAYRFPLDDHEIQYGASLTVRDAQLAVFVNEGKIADVFGSGTYTLTTQTLPVLTYLKNWDKLFESPFKSDVYFFSTRSQLDHKWGTPQPITLRDKDFGAVRLRAFGNYSYHIADAKQFYTHILGTRDLCTTADIDGALRGMVLQHISCAIANSGVAFLDLAANLQVFSHALAKELAAPFTAMGLVLDSLTVQNISLPEELQRVLDQKIGIGMVGNDMAKFMQYQVAQSVPNMSSHSGTSGIASDAMGLGAGMALGQIMAQQVQSGLLQTPASTSTAPLKPEDIFSQLEKMGELKAKGILTEEEFNAKKTELLKKL